ncbi:extracellular solute-binding protein [Paenibacillus rhizovicinus]|uniref:Extracellular solute-binding protein n=1 Tax=Paenibacillus rhizovicinus TaxID=2704463 RepID=A0A6C0NY74_9BACL|nr:extracellular solute-binding protein [Paenibacillus rhizovicinus]QHW31190.1 extracellular solute-binding protein [Paenibacillus rhizovicinus]
MRKKRTRIAIRLAPILVILFGGYRWAYGGEPVTYASTLTAANMLTYKAAGDLLPYAKVMADNQVTAESSSGAPIAIKASEFSDSAPDAQAEKTNDADGESLHWNSDQGWVEWSFDVATAGWYELDIDYMPLPGGNDSVIRGIQIDGKYPFSESQHVELERHWKDAKYPYDRNEIGMQVRPEQVEIAGWNEKAVSDFTTSSEPLLYRLEAGKHTLRLVGNKEKVALRSLTFKPKKAIKTYAEYQTANPAPSREKEWYGNVEGENFLDKSSLMIQTDHWSEPYISPDPKGRTTYNVIGGDRWRNPGEAIEWTINVPADGWYEIDLKAYQNYRNGFKAYRTIEIDGAVPFREMLHYPLRFNGEFTVETIRDKDDKPYRFYLTKGDHRLKMTADASEMQPIQLALNNELQALSDYDRKIRLLTGAYSVSSFDANLDTTRTWDMKKYDPNVEQTMDGFINRLSDIRDYINGVNGIDSDLAEGILSSIDLLKELRKNVDEIPNKIDTFSTIQSNIGTWMTTLTQQSLLLDFITVRTPDTDPGFKVPTAWSRIPYSIKDFARSFYMDYDVSKKNDKDSLTIWVSRGRDYVDLLNEMIDTDFTPKTGIHVNVSLMPNANQLILGNAAGEVPDVALGIGEATPADYAMRDAVEDLSKYPGFEDVAKRFIPGTFRAMAYDGGTYGLPETQNFSVMFYRTDIFDSLGLKAPDTWDDLFTILPTLQENDMTMSYPKADFTTMFFQNGAELYAPNGLKSTLTTPEGMAAFKRWTDLYLKYNLPIDIPAFFQHFRNGDIPIGIADFNTYVQLLVAAPEITGHWKIAPLPGVKQADGTVARWSPQGISAGMIMKKSDNKDEAWKFLQWWTSDEVQAHYAKDIESYYGMEYRWNSANTNAMKTLPWSNEDIAVLREQSKWAKNMPYVPGYYFLSREMDFAWNSTVFDRVPAQEALEKAQTEIQREMDRRQVDFGIKKTDDLHVPQIKKPFNWEESQ